MFTGLIEEVGTVRALQRTAAGARLTVSASFARELRRGESVSVSGACLTALDLDADGFSADVSNESLARTTLGELRAGAFVNLERSLQAGGRLGGHFVLGHVDGVGHVASVSPLGDALRIDLEFPPPLAPLFVEKGSVAIDGVSLTINEVRATSFWIAIIPETRAKTTLGRVKPGERVNVEADVLGKYVLRALAASGRADASLSAALERGGYL